MLLRTYISGINMHNDVSMYHENRKKYEMFINNISSLNIPAPANADTIERVNENPLHTFNVSA